LKRNLDVWIGPSSRLEVVPLSTPKSILSTNLEKKGVPIIRATIIHPSGGAMNKGPFRFGMFLVSLILVGANSLAADPVTTMPKTTITPTTVKPGLISPSVPNQPIPQPATTQGTLVAPTNSSTISAPKVMDGSPDVLRISVAYTYRGECGDTPRKISVAVVGPIPATNWSSNGQPLDPSGNAEFLITYKGTATVQTTALEFTIVCLGPSIPGTPYIRTPVKPTVKNVLTKSYPLSYSWDRDADRDRIGDATEYALLQRFSPLYLFSNSLIVFGVAENYRPTDPVWYIRRSELLRSGDEQSRTIIPNSILINNPLAILTAQTSSDLTLNPRKTDFHIDPVGTFQGDDSNPGRHGQSWETILAKKNVGLFGHVVPYTVPQTAPTFYGGNLFGLQERWESYWQSHWGPYAGRTLYKIEYWQFFGYNDTGAEFDIGDHEGDWATVQLLYDPKAQNIVRVAHYAHGREISFFLHTARSNRIDYLPFGTPILYYTGENFGGTFDDAGATAQENTLMLAKDPATQAFSHPIVYVENGSHEFWPTMDGRFCVDLVLGKGCAPNHAGLDVGHNYLTVNVPNLGEVEAPSNVEGALLILRYNGYWGAYSRLNSPPPGPTLHTEWQWPIDSKLYPRIPPEDFEN